MEKEFIPYEQALALRELGFNEPCMYVFDKQRNNLMCPIYGLLENNEPNRFLNAPLYQQAFRWLGEKYNLHAEPYTINMGAIEYCFQIRDLYSEEYIYDNFVGAGSSYHGTFNTPKEVELACLKKLIEIIKQK